MPPRDAPVPTEALLKHDGGARVVRKALHAPPATSMQAASQAPDRSSSARHEGRGAPSVFTFEQDHSFMQGDGDVPDGSFGGTPGEQAQRDPPAKRPAPAVTKPVSNGRPDDATGAGRELKRTKMTKSGVFDGSCGRRACIVASACRCSEVALPAQIVVQTQPAPKAPHPAVPSAPRPANSRQARLLEWAKEDEALLARYSATMDRAHQDALAELKQALRVRVRDFKDVSGALDRCEADLGEREMRLSRIRRAVTGGLGDTAPEDPSAGHVV